MMENEDFMNEGMEERARYFEQQLASGESFFYDNDELGQLIDYYLDFEQIHLATKAIAFGESLYPFETNYKIKKAEVYIVQRNINDAVKLLEKYRTIEPNNGEIAKLLGDCYALTLQYKRALECYLFAYNQERDNEELLIRLARINFALGNNNKAMSYLNAFPADYTYDEVIIQDFIRLFLDYKKYDVAIDFLKKVIDENPYNYTAWYFTGLLYQKQDNNEEAINAYEFCIAIDVSNTMGHLGKGNCLLELDRCEEAIESYKLSLDKDESDAEVFCNVAECYENLKDDNAAKHYYFKSIKINPHISDAYFGLGTVYKRAQQWSEAQRYFLKAIDIDKYESLYHIELAEVYLIMGNAEQCFQHYKIAYEIDSDTVEILLDFAHAKFDLGLIEESVQLLLENLENHDEDHRMYYRIASYCFTLGHYEKAYNFLHAALDMKPEEYILLYEFAPFTENIENVSNIIDLYTK
ncbi:MAG: tetratricopeptide repeat protein [Bacteroidetes bacterium]|jgi:tetratricopeptide (TPR) repeat protein|nr:tetratricopeptide repeat protein [Bacteroidota bacterium]MDA8930594.1 tetratricopeptide repeat protein [Bacteroidia bacterium]